MRLSIWTASREEQLSSAILSQEIICFQVMKPAAPNLLRSRLLLRAAMASLGPGGLILETVGHTWQSPESHPGACFSMGVGGRYTPVHWWEAFLTQKVVIWIRSLGFLYLWDCVSFSKFFRNAYVKHTLRSLKRCDLLQFPSKDPMHKTRAYLLTTESKCNVLLWLFFSFALDCSLFQSFDFQMTC